MVCDGCCAIGTCYFYCPYTGLCAGEINLAWEIVSPDISFFHSAQMKFSATLGKLTKFNTFDSFSQSL